MSDEEVPMPMCEVCKKNVSVGVACVPGIPYSAAYCEECLKANAHPYGILVAEVAVAGGLENLAPWFREMVSSTLKHIGKTQEEFDQDVKDTDNEFSNAELKRDMNEDVCNGCSAKQTKRVAVSVNGPHDDVRHYCDQCLEVYYVGVQHGRWHEAALHGTVPGRDDSQEMPKLGG
jgi:hypothetical protein